MAKRLYVGNLSHSTTQEQLDALFSQVGEIAEITIVTDRETGRSKGFGFVEMANDADAQEAINRFNGQELDGRPLTVNEARPREERAPRGGGDRGGFGGGGGGDRRRRDRPSNNRSRRF